jgi:RHS repeat-associated protein
VKKWGTGVTTTLYVWNGWELLAETDGSGTATRRYTHAPEGLDFPLAMYQNGTTSLFHLDGQGNVYLLTNTSGTRRSEYRYRAYGDRYVTPVGEAVQSPFGYKAREEDRETGLVYMRHRYYSPRLERFLNQDPIGIAGGLNSYGFVSGSPTNGADPLGLISPCSKVITYNDGKVVSVEYNWQGCEWFFEMWRSMVNMQYAMMGFAGGMIDAFGVGLGFGTVGQGIANTAGATDTNTGDEEDREGSCYERYRFSSLAEGTPLAGAARVVEIAAPISLLGDLAATTRKLAGPRLWGGGPDYASGMNWVFRRFTRGGARGTLTSFGNYASPIIAILGAFVSGYNASIWTQCTLGVLE